MRCGWICAASRTSPPSSNSFRCWKKSELPAQKSDTGGCQDQFPLSTTLDQQPLSVLHDRRHRRSHRSRQDLAGQSAHRRRRRSAARREGARHHPRPGIRLHPARRRRRPRVRRRARARKAPAQHAGRRNRHRLRAAGGGGRRRADAADARASADSRAARSERRRRGADQGRRRCGRARGRGAGRSAVAVVRHPLERLADLPRLQRDGRRRGGSARLSGVGGSPSSPATGERPIPPRDRSLLHPAGRRHGRDRDCVFRKRDGRRQRDAFSPRRRGACALHPRSEPAGGTGRGGPALRLEPGGRRPGQEQGGARAMGVGSDVACAHTALRCIADLARIRTAHVEALDAGAPASRFGGGDGPRGPARVRCARTRRFRARTARSGSSHRHPARGSLRDSRPVRFAHRRRWRRARSVSTRARAPNTRAPHAAARLDRGQSGAGAARRAAVQHDGRGPAALRTDLEPAGGRRRSVGESGRGAPGRIGSHETRDATRSAGSSCVRERPMRWRRSTCAPPT